VTGRTSAWQALFDTNKKKILTKRLDERKPPKPGQVKANPGQRVRLNKAGVGPEVYSEYFEDQDAITAVLKVAENNALAFANESNGNPPMSGAVSAPALLPMTACCALMHLMCTRACMAMHPAPPCSTHHLHAMP
jgi:hypothetical protein